MRTSDQVKDRHPLIANLWRKIGTIKAKMPFWNAVIGGNGKTLYVMAPQRHSILVIDTAKDASDSHPESRRSARASSNCTLSFGDCNAVHTWASVGAGFKKHLFSRILNTYLTWSGIEHFLRFVAFIDGEHSSRETYEMADMSE